MADERDLAPVQEAADEVGLHRSTLHRWVATGRLQSWKRAGDTRTYVDRNELRALLEFRQARRGRLWQLGWVGKDEYALLVIAPDEATARQGALDRLDPVVKDPRWLDPAKTWCRLVDAAET